ncbi:MAG: ABC transporter ATP-binding protein [Egibacteraceae bacterium]
MTALLELKDVTVRYGGLVAVDRVSFSLREDEVISLIGPNGAGKTSLFNAITGFVRPSAGEVRFKDTRITGQRPHQIARAGLARTFQKRSYFPELTVADNLMTAALQRHLHGGDGHGQRDRRVAETAEEILDLVGLAHRRREAAQHLPYGEQRRLGIALAVATNPSVLLLDEPCAGMNHAEIDQVIELIARLRRQRLAIVVVEHQMKFVMGISQRVVVLDHGEKLAEGMPEEVRRNPAVIEAYLGRGARDDAATA